MSNLVLYNEQVFENIKKIDENGVEYWEARELQIVLEYKEWRNFKKVLDRAMMACKLSNIEISDCFVEFNKPIISGKGKKENIIDG